MTTLSALVVVHNEDAQLAECLDGLRFADEIVVVLDKCTDGSRAIAARYTDKLIEGAWDIEGHRRNAGLDACSGDWILEIDADERVPERLAQDIRTALETAAFGYFLVPFDNYIGTRRVRYGWGGSWGVSLAPRLSARGAKRWGDQRIHPSLELKGARQWVRSEEPIRHFVDADLSDMIARLDRYTTARAKDLRDSGDIGSLGNNIRRFFSRFLKCYIGRKGYREGLWGFAIALFAGLYPVLSYLKAKLDEPAPRPGKGPPGDLSG